MLFTHNVKKIEGTAHKNGHVDGMCKRTLIRVVSVKPKTDFSNINLLTTNLNVTEMKVEVDKQVNDELEAIKTEVDYSGEVGTRVKMQVQLEIVCKHILGESNVGNSNGSNTETQPKSRTSGGKKDKIPKTKCETSAEIELPWISDLEPASSKVCILQERKPNYVLITDHIRSKREYPDQLILPSPPPAPTIWTGEGYVP